MHKFICLLSFIICTASSQAQKAAAESHKAQQTIEQMFGALSALDTTSLKQFITPDVRFYEYGEAWTIDSLIVKMAPYRRIPDFRRTNSFRFVNTTVSGNAAWATYYLKSVITANGKEQTANWMETVVLVKDNKQWRVQLLHSTWLNKN